MVETPFDRLGLSSLDDVDTPYCRQLFSELETCQSRFLAQESKFRSAEYLRLWPRSPLYNWSRRWEWPYAIHHLRKFRSRCRWTTEPLAVDVGSGVTFFPFAMAEMGFRVIALDSDPIGSRDYPLACDALGVSREHVSFRLADAKSIPFTDHSVDAVCCISVLEHIPQPEQVVREIARILKPDSVFILTMDIDLRGNSEIGPVAFEKIRSELETWFKPLAPDRTIHPAKLNDSYTEPYPLFRRRGSIRRTLNLGKRILKAMLGQGWVNPKEVWLACYGFVGQLRAPSSETTES